MDRIFKNIVTVFKNFSFVLYIEMYIPRIKEYVNNLSRNYIHDSIFYWNQKRLLLSLKQIIFFFLKLYAVYAYKNPQKPKIWPLANQYDLFLYFDKIFLQSRINLTTSKNFLRDLPFHKNLIQKKLLSHLLIQNYQMTFQKCS